MGLGVVCGGTDGDGSDGLRHLVFSAGSVDANRAKIVSVEGYRMRS